MCSMGNSRVTNKLDNLVVAPKNSWPYTIPDEHKIGHLKPSTESRFNLNHGFMWGKMW